MRVTIELICADRTWISRLSPSPFWLTWTKTSFSASSGFMVKSSSMAKNLCT